MLSSAGKCLNDTIVNRDTPLKMRRHFKLQEQSFFKKNTDNTKENVHLNTLNEHARRLVFYPTNFDHIDSVWKLAGTSLSSHRDKNTQDF